MKNSQSRRKFLNQATLATAALSVPGYLTAAYPAFSNQVAPSDQINVGVIGCNGMGWSNLRAHLQIPGVNCVALADVDQRVLDRRTADLVQMGGKKPLLFKDYRKMLENDNIDVVIIGTPDHWHCLNFVHACEAGKQVYVEKPIANTIEECNVMAKAAARYGTIVQVGQWQRSGRHYADAVDYVQSGELGNIRLVKCWAYQGWMKPLKPKPDTEPPQGVDYKMWLGPAPSRPFNENRFHFDFRWFWDYAGGLMTDWGVHEIDIALMAMGAESPKSILASGGKFAYPDDPAETPDTLQTIYEYDEFNLLWEHATGIDGGPYGRTEGIAFIGNKGTLVVNRQGWEVIPEGERKDDVWESKTARVELQKSTGNALEDHARSFIEAVKTKDPAKLNCTLESGRRAAVNAQMGNIAFKTGRKLYWDQSKGLFTGDAEANDLVKANYHNGWELPKV